jgi:cardiolipin synthase
VPLLVSRATRRAVQALKPAPTVTAAARRAAAPTGDRLLRAGLPTPTATIGQAERAVLKAPSLANRITFHVHAPDAHAALLKSIREAERSFYIETFIWHNDASGNEVIQVLAERIQRARAEGEPFDAKVLVDWFGLRQGTGGSGDTEIIQKLRAIGVDAREFAPGYLNGGKLVPITHRKLYIQDGKQFITGGRNIGDEYLKADFVNPKGKVEPAWHDLFYTVEGDETGRIVDEFFRNWRRAGGEVPAQRPSVVPSPTGRARVESFLTDPHVGIRTLRQAHLDLIAHAERSIDVMYPYLSDDHLIDALIAAKKKNPALAIRVMLPAGREATSEGGVYALLNKESARQLMAHGIEVRMFAGGSVKGQDLVRFSHFKGMVVDDRVVSVGSANGDARTFTSNHELNTVIADRGTAADFIRQVVAPDWASATPLTRADLAADSLWTRLKQRVLEALDFLL